MIRRKKRGLVIAIIGIIIVAVCVVVGVILVRLNTNSNTDTSEEPNVEESSAESNDGNEEEKDKKSDETSEGTNNEPEKNDNSPTDVIPAVAGGNCTTGLGKLMLINANFRVTTEYIANRRSQLIDVTSTYGITELNSWNGRPLLDAEAAMHLNDMVKAYEAEYPNHTMQTVSCFRSVGTSCGRLCAATGTSDHHSGYTCDLIDAAYGTSLDTDDLANHIDWQWLKANSYKYGFIDRYLQEWAGGSMSEPMNLDENGTTGYYETWHYRYVGIKEATEIATGKYNNGKYDSLEHYLLQRGFVNNLKTGTCN